MRTIILLTAIFLLSLSTARAQSAYYKVKFPDDQTITGCYAYPDTVWPEIEKYSDCPYNVGVSVKDQVFNLNAWGGCKKILRTWTLLHWCTYDPNEPWPVYIQNPDNTDVGATVFGVPSNRGHITYTQIIKVLDKEAPIFLDCPADPLVFCDYTGNDPAQYNDYHLDKCEGPVNLGVKLTDLCSESDILLSYRLFLDLDGNGSMETYISSSAPTAWPIDKMFLTGSADTLMASIAFPNGFGLPYGMHKIEWIANDKCGNESICKYAFTVKDCKAPTVVCINGLSINIMSTGMITLWDTDFIKYYNDNCTPADQIKIGIRKAGTGTGFPVDSHSVTFDCGELGKQEVEIWAMDAYGNADFCQTYVIVQDNQGSCPPSPKFKGTVALDDLTPVPGVQVVLKKSGQVKSTAFTGPDGSFEIASMPSGCSYELVPGFDDQAKTGINTIDALLVGGQVDNILALTSPYKLLAADVDNSGNLSSSDVLSIVKLVLGAQDAFPGKPVWQFVPKNYVFPDPLKPWSVSVPHATTFCLSGAMPAPPANFVGIKTGDVNGSVVKSNFAPPADDRKKDGYAVFQTSDQVFAAGKDVRVDIITPELGGFAGFQFTLDFDPSVLSIKSVVPDLVPSDFIATPTASSLTASWHATIMLNPAVVGKNNRLRTFTVVFQALRGGTLSQVLKMSSSVTKAEAYTRSLSAVGAVLRFEPVPVPLDDHKLELMPVWPNPVQDRLTAAFYLPEEGSTTLMLTDARGQVVQTVQAYRERGYHQVEIQLNSPALPGVLFLHLEGPGGAAVQRVMRN